MQDNIFILLFSQSYRKIKINTNASELHQNKYFHLVIFVNLGEFKMNTNASELY